MTKIKAIIKLCSLFIYLFCFSLYAKEPTILKVGLLTKERPPYFFANKEGESPTGLYIDILEKITQDLPVKLEYHFLPQGRVRMYMESGFLDIEPGIDKSWRMLSNEVEQSTYTIPFMQSDEVYAFLGSNKKAIDISKNAICGITGFNMPTDFTHKKIHLVTTEKQLYSMIVKKRCELAIAPIDVINYWNKIMPEKINYSDVVLSYQLRFRLNKKHKALVKALNKNIKNLKESREFESIKKKYIP